MSQRIKYQVRDHLANAPGSWLTVEQLCAMINTSHHSTVARALRKLREEGYAVAQRVSGDPRCRREWSYATTTSMKISLTYVAPNPSNRSTSMPTFNSAVEAVVAEFVAAGKTFSAHDITDEVRQRSNAGTLVIDAAETGTCYNAGSSVPRVEHNEVRDRVHDLFTAGSMPGYDRKHTGQYWQYVPPAPAAVVAPDPADDGSGYDGGSLL